MDGVNILYHNSILEYDSARLSSLPHCSSYPLPMPLTLAVSPQLTHDRSAATCGTIIP